MNNKLKSMFSLCKRSGNMLSGDMQVTKALSGKKAKLIIVATDVSDNTKENFKNKSAYYGVPYIEFGFRDEISALIGTNNKTVFCVTDENFSNKIKELISLETTEIN